MPFGADETLVAVNASIIVDMAQMLTCARSYICFLKKGPAFQKVSTVSRRKKEKEGRKPEGKNSRTKVCWVCEKSSKTKVGSGKEQKITDEVFFGLREILEHEQIQTQRFKAKAKHE